MLFSKGLGMDFVVFKPIQFLFFRQDQFIFGAVNNLEVFRLYMVPSLYCVFNCLAQYLFMLLREPLHFGFWRWLFVMVFGFEGP